MGGCESDEPPLSDATSLQCPTPGALPFRLESNGFRESSNRSIASNNPRNKDESSDIIGNPGGVSANVYLPESQQPSAGPLSYAGMKARTTPAQGLFSKPLVGENVSLWYYDAATTTWSSLDRGTTDDNGLYAFSADGFVSPNAEPVYAVLEADGSCAAHSSYLLPSGSKFVVMDIDGTLTTSDNELLVQVTDEAYVPMMMGAANTLAQAWAAKGYPIVYLTARTHVFDAETRAWLDRFAFPKGPLITEGNNETADVYKTRWLRRMIMTFGWVPYAAYGNATTDITAYANAGIALNRTFIIGPEAGMGGTVAIPNNDYTQHIATFVNAQPNNQ